MMPEPHHDAHRLAWQHVAEWAALAALVVFAAGAVASAARVPLVYVAVGGAVLALTVAASAAVTASCGAVKTWWTLAALTAAGWVSWVTAAGPWSWRAVAALATPAAVLAIAWPAVRVHEAHLAADAAARAAGADAAAASGRWPGLLAAVGLAGVRYAGQDSARDGHYTVRLTLPADGSVTIAALHQATERLEIAAKMRRGALRFEPGPHAHEAALHVSERDVLAEVIPLPVDPRKHSIREPLPVGCYIDGQVCEITLREVAVLIAGLRGSGKSSLLNVLVAQLARRVDVIVFVIDLKHRFARAWLGPWLARQAPHPVLDWVATDLDEARRMLAALGRGIDARSRAGHGEKHTPTAAEPAVILIMDETASTLGVGTGGARLRADGVTHGELAALATKITMTGRSEAIDPVFCVLRPSVPMLGVTGGELKAQTGLRIGLGVATEADARSLFPDSVAIPRDLARLAEPGTGIVQRGHGRALPVKFYRLEPDGIWPLAVKAGGIRPGPDPLLLDALGDDYATRWDRAAWLGAAVPPARAAAPPSETDAEFRRIAAASGLDRPASDPRDRMRQYLYRFTDGVSVAAIVRLLEVKGTPVDRSTIHRWLREDEAAGLVEHLPERQKWRWRQAR